MTEVIYIGPVRPGVELDDGRLAEFNVPIEVDEESAAGLLATSIWTTPGDDAYYGNVDEVLAAVGDDPNKAAAALQVEQAKSRPRTTLVEALEAIVNEAADSGEEE